MSDPSAWLSLSVEAIGAIGSAGAAIVAVVLANRERTERRRAQAELRAEKRRVQATHVLAQCHARILFLPDGMAEWVVEVQNTSTAPIRRVSAEAWSTTTPALRGSAQLGDIAPGATKSADIGLTLNAIDAQSFDYRLHFRDAAGVAWLRDADGNLTDLTAEFPPET